MKPLSYRDAYLLARETLCEQGEADPAVAARVLVCGLFDISASELFLRADEQLDEGHDAEFDEGHDAEPDEGQKTQDEELDDGQKTQRTKRLLEALRRRAQGEPLQYITGRAPFRHLELTVGPGAFIPRPETETLIDIVKEYLRDLRLFSVVHPAQAEQKNPFILDVGTGSGCIALALFEECPDVEIIATDISENALEVARQNARRLGFSAAKRLRFLCDDVASSLLVKREMFHRFDVVVSNPPYIPSAELQELPNEITQYEPLQALDGGADGLEFFRRIVEQAAVLLKPGGLLVCELHETTLAQAACILEQAAVWRSIGCHYDLNGCPRFITALSAQHENAQQENAQQQNVQQENTDAFAAALAALKRGEAVIFPTDTVYGIGVAVGLNSSPDLIYRLKGRDADKALPWLVDDITALDRYAKNVPAYAYNLAKKFWPGALTLILEASDEVPPAFRAKDNSIALRLPDHATTLALIRELGAPIATSSANRQGKPPATSPDSIDPVFIRAGVYVLDAGLTSAQTPESTPASTLAQTPESTPASVPSTLVSCLGAKPLILRHGILNENDLK